MKKRFWLHDFVDTGANIWLLTDHYQSSEQTCFIRWLPTWWEVLLTYLCPSKADLSQAMWRLNPYTKSSLQKKTSKKHGLRIKNSGAFITVLIMTEVEWVRERETGNSKLINISIQHNLMYHLLLLNPCVSLCIIAEVIKRINSVSRISICRLWELKNFVLHSCFPRLVNWIDQSVFPWA